MLSAPNPESESTATVTVTVTASVEYGNIFHTQPVIVTKIDDGPPLRYTSDEPEE